MNEDIIMLTDDEGKETPFELLDFINYEGNDYAVLLPADDEDSEEVVILRIENEDSDPDNETLVTVEDENVLEAVFGIFMEKLENAIEDEDLDEIEEEAE